jgi:hypothetical protein
MDWLNQKWQQVKQDPFWGLVILAILAVAGMGRFFGWMNYFKETVASLISRGISIDTATRKVTISNPLAWAAVAIIAVIVLIFLKGLRMWEERNSLLNDLRNVETATLADKEIVERTFEKMMSAASRICAQLFPRDGRPQKNILSFRTVLLVDKDFTATVSCDWEFKAITNLYFEQFNIGAETEADPCKYLDDIDCKVRDSNPLNSIPYLPTENSLYSKKITVFFLPHMTPDEPIARKICVSYKWPGMMRRLKIKGSEVGGLELVSRDPIPIAEEVVYFAPEIKEKIYASVYGDRLPREQELLERAGCEIVGYEGYGGWRYQLKNAPPGTYKIEFTFKP